MKHSIVTICKKLSSALLLNTLLTIFVALFILEQNFSYKKIDNLNQQRELINSLQTMKENDKQLAHIKSDGTINLILARINHLKQYYTYDFVGKFIIFSQEEYFADLNRLQKTLQEIKELLDQYYTGYAENRPKVKERLSSEIQRFNKELDDLFIKNVAYNQKKSSLIAKFTIFLLFISIITTLYYRKKVNIILSDISFLTAIHPTSKNYKTKTIEADAILMKMTKKNTNTIDPELLDPVTELLNHRGLSTVYIQKKNQKPEHYTSVTIVEIRNFSKENKQYPQEVIQAILKKVASILALFEQPSDIIARTDFNKFTIVLSRASKEQCFKEIEQIVQSIQEIKFKLPNGDYKNIDVTAAFVIKTKKRSLDDALKEAITILEFAKKHDGLTIAQKRDMTDLEI